MADLDVIAGQIAAAFAEAEEKLGDLAALLKNKLPNFENIGPLNRATAINEIRGALGQVQRTHLHLSVFDPRITTQDGGGGK